MDRYTGLHGHTQPDTGVYGNCHTDRRPDGNCYRDGDWYANEHAYPIPYGGGHGYTHSDAYSHAAGAQTLSSHGRTPEMICPAQNAGRSTSSKTLL
jgi:hypothetical protein